MPRYQDWQHAAFLNQLVANVDTQMSGGYYLLEMRLTARQLDQLAAIALVFDALAHAKNGPPDPQNEGGD